MKINHRNRSAFNKIKRNKSILVIGGFVVIFIFYTASKKLTQNSFKIVRGVNLENFKNDEKILIKNSNLNVFFIDADPGDEKVFEDGRQACSVESAGEKVIKNLRERR